MQAWNLPLVSRRQQPRPAAATMTCACWVVQPLGPAPMPALLVAPALPWCRRQGVVSHMIRDVAARRAGPVTRVGLGTFCDAREKGGKLTPGTRRDIVHLVQLGRRELLWYEVSALRCPLQGCTARACSAAWSRPACRAAACSAPQPAAAPPGLSSPLSGPSHSHSDHQACWPPCLSHFSNAGARGDPRGAAARHHRRPRRQRVLWCVGRASQLCLFLMLPSFQRPRSDRRPRPQRVLWCAARQLSHASVSSEWRRRACLLHRRAPPARAGKAQRSRSVGASNRAPSALLAAEHEALFCDQLNQALAAHNSGGLVIVQARRATAWRAGGAGRGGALLGRGGARSGAAPAAGRTGAPQWGPAPAPGARQSSPR